MALRRWINLFGNKNMEEKDKGEDVFGFRILVPPGRSLVITFEGCPGSQVVVDYPQEGKPEVGVRANPTSDTELFEMGRCV